MESLSNGALLFAVAGGMYMLAGFSHTLGTLIDVRSPRFFTPTDDRVRQAMIGARVRLAGDRGDMWRAWLGFNISHGLGAFFFGAIVLGSAFHGGLFSADLVALAPFYLSVAIIYVIVSWRFWFLAPTVGCAIGALLFALGWALL